MKSVTKSFIIPLLMSCLMLPGKEMFAQSTTIKLPTTNNTSSFNITKSDDTNLFRLFGDNGFYFGGSVNSGAIPITGAGMRLMWYPRRGAFRAGEITGDQWDDAKTGYYSMGLGYNITASGLASTALGIGTAAAGDYSLAMGFNTVASSNNSTAMGANTIAAGSYSTAIGFSTTASGSYSVAVGSSVSTNSLSGAFIFGDNSSNGTELASSAANQMMMRFAGGYRLFTNSGATSGVSIGAGGNSWSAISDSTKKENFVHADGEYFLNSLSKLRLGSWNYKTQAPKEYRHYGPMAQEIFHYFGKDSFGTIGNDTTLASADMDGIIMICLQALEKRTSEMVKASEKISELEATVYSQDKKILDQQNKIEDIEKELKEMKELVINGKQTSGNLAGK